MIKTEWNSCISCLCIIFYEEKLPCFFYWNNLSGHWSLCRMISHWRWVSHGLLVTLPGHHGRFQFHPPSPLSNSQTQVMSPCSNPVLTSVFAENFITHTLTQILSHTPHPDLCLPLIMPAGSRLPPWSYAGSTNWRVDPERSTVVSVTRWPSTKVSASGPWGVTVTRPSLCIRLQWWGRMPGPNSCRGEEHRKQTDHRDVHAAWGI